MSHEAICPCNLQCNFCRKQILQVAVRMSDVGNVFCDLQWDYIFTPAEYLKMSAGFWLCRIVIGSFSKNWETSCSGGVTRCFYFLCNLQRNFLLLDQSGKHGVLHEDVFLATCNATPLRCVESCKENCLVWHGLNIEIFNN